MKKWTYSDCVLKKEQSNLWTLSIEIFVPNRHKILEKSMDRARKMAYLAPKRCFLMQNLQKFVNLEQSHTVCQEVYNEK